MKTTSLAVTLVLLTTLIGVAAGADDVPPKSLKLALGNKVTIEFVSIAPGKFTMGSAKEEKDRLDNEGPQKETTISKMFYMGIYPVTQEQYQAIMGANPSKFKGPKNPVEQVTWVEATAFCKKVSAKTGKKFRLPTEAEWEYACRAGSKTRFHFGDNDRALGDNDWFDGNSNKTTHPVGQKKPNAFGLYDMHGNVWQFCSDWYADSHAGAADKDPLGPKSGKNHVLKGGSWIGSAFMCRSAFRTSTSNEVRAGYFGFRAVVAAD